MSSPACALFTASVLLVACGSAPAESASASVTDSTTATTATLPMTDGTTVDASGTTADAPTTSAGTASVSDSGTSTGGTTLADTTTVADTSTGDPSTTGAPQTTTTAVSASTTDASTSTTSTTDASTSSSGGDESTGESVLCACPDIEVPLDDGVFVLSGDAELWKYFPKDNTFSKLGDLACPGLFSTFSMAVDRQGFAWVQFTDGQLRKIDVTDISQCEDPGYQPGQLGVDNFGMAFVSNSIGDPCDRIYGNTYDGIGPFAEGPNLGDFIHIDPVTLKLSKQAKTSFNGAEVTGTGDGRAFLFGGANPSKLVEIDKATGMAKSTFPLAGLEINNGAFAFAFFGGDFYFFTDSNTDGFASEVTHLDYDDSDMNGQQHLTKIFNAAPLLIVGAGVSTCAPFLPQ